MLQSLTIILLHLALGELISRALKIPVPGNIFGMLLLFLSLLKGFVKPAHVRPAVDLLTKNMSLFFVPAGVGLIMYSGLLKNSWEVIVLASVFSTLLVLAIVGILHQKFETR
ncbi:MAG TPA: CidA/LrgA family protein [Patescibacteria group bacterium]|nr:CidA/LrgA family protein [Patescibacteria group bacterium]